MDKKQTFLEWVEDLCEQLSEVEIPDVAGLSTYQKGFRKGCYETQLIIGKKLKFAIEQEKKKLETEEKYKKEMEEGE